jgi:hypothetical protein
MSNFPRLNEWMEVYERELVKSRAANPGKYLWADDKLSEIVDHMRQGFARGPGQFNKDTPVVLAVCQHFGIPRTYRSIDAFLRGKKA